MRVVAETLILPYSLGVTVCVAPYPVLFFYTFLTPAKCSMGIKAGEDGTGPSGQQGQHGQRDIHISLLIH